MNVNPFIILLMSTIISLKLCEVNGARILAIFVFPGKSHFMMTKTLIKELTNRGHEVTLITSFPMDSKLNNYTEILIDPIYNFWSDIKQEFHTDNLFDLTELNMFDFMKMLEIIGLKTTEYSLKQPAIQNIINSKDTKNKYDLLISEQFYQEAYLSLAIKYQIPVISVCTFGYANYMSQMMGFISPWSFVPHTFTPLNDQMNFLERLLNTLFNIYEDFYREYYYFPKQDKLMKKYFSSLGNNIPLVSKLEKNVSAILLNSYTPLTTTRPSVPGLIPVGGLHIIEPKILPNDIKIFLDDAKDGAIYFSLGTNIRSAELPPEKLKMFLEVFRSIKQRILWKWEDENIPELPSNVMVKKWMPQNDILSHPNVKVFITHGGLLGTQEGVYHGIPMLGIPIYCDQYMNMNKAKQQGYGLTLNFQKFTKDELNFALNELLHNPSYINNVKRISEIFRDRPMSAIDTAMYWIEYIIRYKGASQIRSAGAELPWYKFYLLDVIGFLLLIVSTVIAVVTITCKKLFKRSTSKKNINKVD